MYRIFSIYFTENFKEKFPLSKKNTKIRTCNKIQNTCPILLTYFCFKESELDRITRAREAEMKYLKEQNLIEINKARDMANIDTEKFENTVKAIGADTLKSIAVSGPETQVRVALVCPLLT